MKPSQHGKLLRLMKLAPFALCAALVVLCLCAGERFTVEAVLAYTPENPLLAACVLLLLYAIKSLSIVFPLVVLQIAGGLLFPPAVALAINFLGMLVVLALPYGVGRLSGAELVGQLTRRYPKLSDLLGRQKSSAFFLCFFLRVISCLPGDVISMYLGATMTPFPSYLIASALGILPGMVCATLLGASAADPGSPMFVFSLCLTVALSLGSAVIYWLYRRRAAKTDAGGEGPPYK